MYNIVIIFHSQGRLSRNALSNVPASKAVSSHTYCDWQMVWLSDRDSCHLGTLSTILQHFTHIETVWVMRAYMALLLKSLQELSLECNHAQLHWKQKERLISLWEFRVPKTAYFLWITPSRKPCGHTWRSYVNHSKNWV